MAKSVEREMQRRRQEVLDFLDQEGLPSDPVHFAVAWHAFDGAEQARATAFVASCDDLAWRDAFVGIALGALVSRPGEGAESDAHSVIVAGVDHLEQLLPVHGPNALDRIQDTVLAAVRRELRAEDFVSHFRGDTLIVLPQTSIAVARSRAERLRERVASLRFRRAEVGFGVTVSSGVTEMTGEPPVVAVERASQGLRIGRRSGGNQVVVMHRDSPDVGIGDSDTEPFDAIPDVDLHHFGTGEVGGDDEGGGESTLAPTY